MRTSRFKPTPSPKRKPSAAPAVDRIDVSKRFLYLLLVVLVATLMIVLTARHWKTVNSFVHRVLSQSVGFSIGSLLSVNLASRSSDRQLNASWAISERVIDQLTVRSVRFAEGDSPEKEEYIELSAEVPLDLTNGFIGDRDQLFQIACPETIYLERGDTIRIYTSYKNWSASRCSFNKEDRKFHAQVKCPDFYKRKEFGGDECPGLYPDPMQSVKDVEKGTIDYFTHRGDRIVIMEADGTMVLDLDFWWINRDN